MPIYIIYLNIWQYISKFRDERKNLVRQKIRIFWKWTQRWNISNLALVHMIKYTSDPVETILLKTVSVWPDKSCILVSLLFIMVNPRCWLIGWLFYIWMWNVDVCGVKWPTVCETTCYMNAERAWKKTTVKKSLLCAVGWSILFIYSILECLGFFFVISFSFRYKVLYAN